MQPADSNEHAYHEAMQALATAQASNASFLVLHQMQQTVDDCRQACIDRNLSASCVWCQPPKAGVAISDSICEDCKNRLLAEWRGSQEALQ